MYVPPEQEWSTDDKDLISVVIPNIRHYFGLKEYGSRGTIEIKEDEWDVVCYEFLKMVRLMKQGNPNVLSTLWVNPGHIVQINESGTQLIKHRNLFVGRHVFQPFVGYAKSQMERMVRGESVTGRGFMGEKRKQLREKYGYDTKHASHMIRLLRMGTEFLKTGIMNVDRSKIDAEELVSIKQGKFPLSVMNGMYEYEMQRIVDALLKSSLPPEPDHEAIDVLIEDILQVSLYPST